jgi:CBS domain-containing protein
VISGMEETIQRLYSRNIIHINKNANLVVASDLMNDYNIRHLPVVDDDKYLVGVLSKTDFYALRYANSRFKGFQVKDLMSSPVKIVNPSTKVCDVAETLITSKISCVLIAKDDELVGILTTDDLLRLLAEASKKKRDFEQLDLEELADEGWISATRFEKINQ